MDKQDVERNFFEIFSKKESRDYFFELLETWRSVQRERFQIAATEWLKNKRFNSSREMAQVHQEGQQTGNEHPQILTSTEQKQSSVGNR